MSMPGLIEHMRYRRLLDAHVDGELTDPTLDHRVEQHIARCPMCRHAARVNVVVKQRLTRRFLPTHRRPLMRREDG